MEGVNVEGFILKGSMLREMKSGKVNCTESFNLIVFIEMLCVPASHGKGFCLI